MVDIQFVHLPSFLPLFLNPCVRAALKVKEDIRFYYRGIIWHVHIERIEVNYELSMRIYYIILYYIMYNIIKKFN